MKVSRISAITLIVLFLIAGICFSQSTGEYHHEGVQHNSEARFEEEYIEQIKQLVKGLEYSDKVAEDFVQMVSGWKDVEGRPVLTLWKQKLTQAKEEYKQGKIFKDQLAKVEENITKELSQRIQKEISFNIKFFDLADVIKRKQAHCLGYSQLLYILGNFLELSVKTIDVVELMTGALTSELGHIASIVSLTDGKMMMVDLVPAGFVSKPFIIEKEFAKVDNYWELKDEDNPLGIHRRIQIFDRNGLIAVIYNERGTTYYNLGQYNQAISDFTKAIELNPKYAWAYYIRGGAYHNLRQYPKAIFDYTKAIELNPKFAEAYWSRGGAYGNLGQPNQAISDYTRAIELDPKYAEAYMDRGITYHESGQPNQAISDFTKASDAYYNRGIAYLDSGQYQKAISDLTEASKLNAMLAEIYHNLGAMHYDSGQYQKAISDFTKAIEFNPKSAEAYNNRGASYHESGQYEKAISDFTKAIKLNPKFAEAYYSRGFVYASLGKFEEAKKDLLKAVELNPALKAFVKEVSDHFKLNLKLE